MTTYLQVSPGVDMSRALAGARLTKKWLRDYLRANPHKDFRVLTPGVGSYVNGEDCIRQDLVLEVYASSIGAMLVGTVNFQSTRRNEWGYQAVVA